MKTFLQNLLIFFALALCALIAIQWVRENRLYTDMKKLNNTLHDKLEVIQNLEQTVKRYEGEIQRLSTLNKQLTDTVHSNDVQIAKLSTDLRKLEHDYEINTNLLADYKVKFAEANASIEKQNESIRTLNADLKNLAGQYSGVITNLNVLSKMINDTVTKWTRMGEEMQKGSAAAQREAAATNLVTMTKDFNVFVQQWNQMRQQLAGKSANTNAPANNP